MVMPTKSVRSFSAMCSQPPLHIYHHPYSILHSFDFIVYIPLHLITIYIVCFTVNWGESEELTTRIMIIMVCITSSLLQKQMYFDYFIKGVS